MLAVPPITEGAVGEQIRSSQLFFRLTRAVATACALKFQKLGIQSMTNQAEEFQKEPAG